ncbi:maternal protein tudor-like [Planococcus citri]|uniref:maternal protein tudor-like n=1 Tax=Planococcus citri TaxID=170843 RepID=UPI0031F74BE1
MMPMASLGSVASMPQELTYITTDSFFIKVWGIVEKDKADFVRDVIDVYVPKLAEGVGHLRSLSELVPGKVVLAIHSGQFHRAEVMQIHGTKVVVFFIDLGVLTSVDANEIRLADGVFNSIPRTGFAEDFILHGTIARRAWTNQDTEMVNVLLRHCTEINLTGVIGDKRTIQVTLSLNNQPKVNLSHFLIEGGLADAIAEDQLTNLIRAKYGKTTASSTNQNQFAVPPPSIPSLPVPSSFTVPQQTQIRGPSISSAYANDSLQAPVSNSHPYQKIRGLKPIQNIQSVAAVQNYTYSNLPVDSAHDVIVSSVIDGMKAFTIQLKKSSDVDLPKLMAKINDIRLVPFTEQIGPGALCLGRFTQDNSLCRAVVSNVSAEGASLYFVDFGNTDFVPFNEIYRIPPEFLQQPTMAIRFGLTDVTSTSLDSEEARTIFSNLVLHEDLALRLKVLKSLVPSQQCCDLFIVTNGKCINIKNKILDKMKLMKPVEYKKTLFKKNQVHDVIVTFAESPFRFFVQLEVNQGILDLVMQCVRDYCNNAENKEVLYVEDVVENMAVCAPYEDNTYYRGIIVDEPDGEGNITVFYVDYGNHDTVHYSKLRIMNNEMMSQFPTQAVECRLDIDSALVNNEELTNMFIEMADGGNFKMTVKNILPAHVLLVDLVDSKGLNLGECLMETFGVKSSAYAAPPKAPLQKSSSGNWREKNSSTMEGDFSSFRDERARGDPRDDRLRSDSNSNHFRSSHDDRVRGRNFEPKRRDSDGVDTTDEAAKKSDFWGREKGSKGDSAEAWRHDKFNGDGRDRNDRGSYRKRDDENDSWNARNNQDDSKSGGGERRFERGGRSRDWENKADDDEFGGEKSRRDGGFGGRREEDGFRNRREDGGFRGRREDGGSDFGGRPPRRDDNDRPPRRDNRSNDNAWDNKNANSWDNNKENKTDDAWGSNERTNDSGWGSQNNQSNDRGGKRDFGNDRGGSFGDDSRGRKDGGFRRRDDNFSSNSDTRGPRKWDNDFGSRDTVTLLDGFEKGAQIVDVEYQSGHQIDSVISWFVNPVNFYLIPSDDADFRNLMEQIQSEYPTRKTLNTNELSPNDYVVARDKDNVIYRATVLRTSPRGVVVTFVDYGNTETVGKNQVWAINPDHCLIPKQATLCSLQNIASNDENGVWKATSEYDNYFGKDRFKATLIENVQQDGSTIWMVNLTDPDGQDVADQLVANNLALRKVVLSSEELYDFNLFVNQKISVFTGAVVSSKKFFVHIEPDKADHIGTSIQELSDNPANLIALPAENIVTGGFCLAPSSDEALYRALILNVNSEEKQVHVLFIDYGDETDVSFDMLKILPDYLKTYNPQAVQCCLYDSESFTNDEDFIQNIDEKDFIIKVMKVQDNVLHVKLFDVEGKALPYPVESDETVPVVCCAPVLRPLENVVVSSVTSEKAFLQRPADQYAVNELNNRLFEKYDKEAEQDKVDVEEGKFYVAKSGQFEAWYRCKLLEPGSDKIFFIDYGNTEPIEGLLAIRPLDEEFCNVPACCFAVSTDADISAESTETLMTAIQDIVFKAVTKNTSTDASPNVELFADLYTEEGGVTKTFADYVVELNCGSKRSSEPITIYNAFENWKPNESRNVVVSAVGSPTNFYVMLREDVDKLTKLQEDLESALKTVLPLVGDTDTLCAAKSVHDNRWYRCYQSNNLAVDCGLVIQPSEFKKLPGKFTVNRDKFVVECRLDVSSPTSEWHTDTITNFKDLVKPENELVAKLDAITDGKMVIDLISNGTSVTELLLNEGLVKYQAYEVNIPHAVSLSEFYIHDPANEDELQDLLDKMEESEEIWEKVVPEKGQIVAAKFPEDNQWYRAEVISVEDGEINVSFIDYGNQSVCTEFRALPEELSQKPKFAMRCSAHPLPENADELKDKFVEFVNEHTEDLYKVYYLSRHQDPLLVMLYFGEEIIDKYLVESSEPEPQRPSLEFKTVSVVHVNSPSSFYVQTETPLLDELDDLLGAIGNGDAPLVENMTVGTLYAAKFLDDGVWYRAKAISSKEVLFIDFGNTSVVEEVRELSEDVAMIPFLAKHCAFKSPPGLDEWPQVATERFNELTCNGDAVFAMDIVEEGNPAFVQLIDNGLSVIDELYTLCKAELTAPANENEKPSVIISYVTDLSEFWIQDTTPALDELCDELTNVETFDPIEISAVEPDTVVAALFNEDGVWYRAKVLQKSDESCKVLFIDYGNESDVTQVKALPEDLAGMPAFATRCRLSALPNDAATNWPSAVLDKLKEFENGDTFVVMNKEVKDEITYVSLQSEAATELGQQLIELRDQLINQENPQQPSTTDDVTDEIPEDQQQTADDVVPKAEEVEPESVVTQNESETQQSPNSTCVVTEAVSESESHLQNDAAQVEHVQNTIQSNNESDDVESQKIEPVVGEVVSALDEDHNTSKIDSVDENKELLANEVSDVAGTDVTDGSILTVGKSEEQTTAPETVPTTSDEKIEFDYESVIEPSSENDTIIQSTVASFPSSIEELVYLTEQSSEKDAVQPSSNVEQLIDNEPIDEQEDLSNDAASNSQNDSDQPSLSPVAEKVIDCKSDAESERLIDDPQVIQNDETVTVTESPIDVDTRSNDNSVQQVPSLLSCARKVVDNEIIADAEKVDDSGTSLNNSDTSLVENNTHQSFDENIATCEDLFEVTEVTLESPAVENHAEVAIPEERTDADVACEIDPTIVEEITTKEDNSEYITLSLSKSVVSEVDDLICKTETTLAETSNVVDSIQVDNTIPDSNVLEDVQADEKQVDDDVTAEFDISSDSSSPVKISDEVSEKISTSEDIVSEQETLSSELNTSSEIACDDEIKDEQDANDEEIVTNEDVVSKQEAFLPESNAASKITGDIEIEDEQHAKNVSKVDGSSENLKQVLDDTEIICQPTESSDPAESEDAVDSETVSDESSHTIEPSENDISVDSPTTSTSNTAELDPEPIVENSEESKLCDADMIESPFESPRSLEDSKSESVYLSMEEDAENDGEKGSLDVSLGSCSTFVGGIESESLLLNDATENKEEESEPKTKETPATVAAAEVSPEKSKSRHRSIVITPTRKLVSGVDYSVTCVENPGSFYVQRVTDKKFIQSLVKHLVEAHKKKNIVSDVEIGSMYGAAIGNSLFRVRVLDSDPNSSYHVCCLDYGNTVYVKELFELTFELKAPSPFATRCGLPLPAHLNVWPLDVAIHFEEITLLNNPVFKVEHVVPTEENAEIQMVNLTNEEFDVWQIMKEMCVKYEEDDVIEEVKST